MSILPFQDVQSGIGQESFSHPVIRWMANLFSGRAASDTDTIAEKGYAAYHRHPKNLL